MLFSLLAASWYISVSMEHIIIERAQDSLKAQALILGDQLGRHISSNNFKEVDGICKKSVLRVNTRITVILPDGSVIGDSEGDPLKMENHKNRSEISKALSGAAGFSIRFSGTLRQRMMYVALPFIFEDKIKAVVRTSLPLTVIDNAVSLIKVKIIIGVVCIAVFASFVFYIASRRISRPVEKIKYFADKFAKGDLENKIPAPKISELSSLSEALNKMAVHLNNRIEKVVSQRNEYIAVLSSMIEGVIAIDMNDEIIGINEAAAKMFNISRNDVKGKSIQATLRNSDINKALENILNENTAVQESIVVFNDKGENFFDTFITPICNSANHRIGTLLVFHDITQKRRLDIMRKDFVANVSHEIRTPLTAIKGFVETLHYCIDKDKKETGRFLQIIIKHVNRLEVILDDLLSLAKLEKKEEAKEFVFEKRCIKNVLETAVQVLESKAKEKNINIEIKCDGKIMAMIDAGLFEQAIVNLLDNAIKYSPDKTAISINARRDEKKISIGIEDSGCGIPKEHIPRLFERFYRVDKARSRELGGSGLGLSIVKHIVKAHGGDVYAESSLGRGSTFTILLPFQGI